MKTIFLEEILHKKKNNFTLLRIILAIVIIYSHSIVLSGSSQKDFFLYISCLEDGGSISVKIFFFLSGLLITNSCIKNFNLKKYFLARICRIIPAYYFTIILTVFLVGPFLSKTETLQEYFFSPLIELYLQNFLFNVGFFLPKVFLTNPYPAIVNGNFWTLPIEIICYFILAILMILRKRISILLFRIIFFTVGYLILFDPIYNGNIINLFPNETIHFTFLLPSFFIGVTLGLVQHKVKITLQVGVTLLLITFLCKGTVFYLYSFYIFVFWAVLWFFSQSYIIKIKIIDCSYGIYLYSFFCQQALISYIDHNNFKTFFACSVIISFICGILSWYLIEKKFINFSKRF